jgi:hypothetical protein
MGFTPVLSVDFDGVIHSYTSKWAGIAVIPDPPVPGAIEALKQYAKHFRVAVYSTRSETFDGRQAMAEYLVKNGLDPRYIESSDRELYDIFTHPDPEEAERLDREFFECADRIYFPLTKPPALVMIDDRAYRFEGVWPGVDEIQSFKPWNKR